VKLQIYNKAAEEKTGVKFEHSQFVANAGAESPILIQEQQPSQKDGEPV